MAKYTRFDPRNKKKDKNKISKNGDQSRTRFVKDLDDWGADIKKVPPARLQQIIESNG